MFFHSICLLDLLSKQSTQTLANCWKINNNIEPKNHRNLKCVSLTTQSFILWLNKCKPICILTALASELTAPIIDDNF